MKKKEKVIDNSLKRQLDALREKHESALEDNNFSLAEHISLRIENIKLQMQIEHLMQPAVQKRMLATPKILVIKNNKTIGEIESELLTKAQAYDNLVCGEVEELIETLGELKVNFSNYLNDDIGTTSFKGLLKHSYHYKQIKNHILAQAKELEELKKAIKEYIKFEEIDYSKFSDKELSEHYEIWDKLAIELKQLCKGADRK